MKKILLASLLALSAFSSFAQMSGRIGQVGDLDNIVLQPGQQVQLMTIDHRVVTISAAGSLGCQDDRTPGYPGSQRPGGGFPRDPRDNDMRRGDLERLSDRELIDRARFRGIGQCRVEDGNQYSHCPLYVKVGMNGYPRGTGCADNLFEAAQSLRQAIRSGICL